MTDNPTHAAFVCLRNFASMSTNSPLDRLTTETAAAWLAHATSYGITGEDSLLREIADQERNPVERAKTLTRALVKELSAAQLPMSAPFQTVDLFYGGFDDESIGTSEALPIGPLENEIRRGPQP